MLFVGFALSSKVQEMSESDVVALADDAHLVIGGVPMVVPFVVIQNQNSMSAFFTLDRNKAREDWKIARNSFRRSASNASRPLAVDKLDLRFRALGWQEVSGNFGKQLCKRLTRQWSRSICFDVEAPLLEALPYNSNITFVDDRRLENFGNDYSFAGYKKTLATRLGEMSWKPEKASVVCEKSDKSPHRSCTAAIPIMGHLVAVWSVWDTERETAEQMAKRQGLVIVALMKYGLGSTEDFRTLQSLARKLKKPSGTPIDAPER